MSGYTFNSREYAFSDVSSFIGGKSITGLRAVKYTAKQEKEALYGKGNDPLSIQRGNKSYEGEVGLTQSEINTLEANSPTGSILDIQVDIIVCYGDPEKGDIMKTDKLVGCEFTEDPREMKQGDKFMDVSVPFIFLRKEPIV